VLLHVVRSLFCFILAHDVCHLSHFDIPTYHSIAYPTDEDGATTGSTAGNNAHGVVARHNELPRMRLLTQYLSQSTNNMSIAHISGPIPGPASAIE
jgi:hypothetical protein